MGAALTADMGDDVPDSLMGSGSLAHLDAAALVTLASAATVAQPVQQFRSHAEITSDLLLDDAETKIAVLRQKLTSNEYNFSATKDRRKTLRQARGTLEEVSGSLEGIKPGRINADRQKRRDELITEMQTLMAWVIALDAEVSKDALIYVDASK
jgi:hypothetical protein